MTALPAGWRLSNLGELASSEARAITDGPFGSNLTSAHYTESGPRVIRLQNIGDGRFIDNPAHISQEHFKDLRAHEAVAGDLIVASLGQELPRACLVPAWLGPAIVKADCIRVRLGEQVDPRWALYAMQTPTARRWAAEQLHGVGRPRLGLKVIRDIPVPLPPIEEQRRIVDVLEDHLSRLDAAVQTLRSSRERLPILHLSALRRIRDVALAAGSPLRRIGEVAQTDLGKMLDAKRAVGEPTPYLRNVNVRWGQVDLSDIRTVPLTERERTDFALQRGDLLVCEGGEPGRCAIWNADAASLMTYQKALHRVRVRPDADVSAEFLALMIEEFIRTGRANRLFTGTTIKHLPQEKLRMIELPVPPVCDQQEAVRCVKETTSSSVRFSSEILRAESRSEGLRRSLLRAAFSGRLASHPSTSSLGSR